MSHEPEAGICEKGFQVTGSWDTKAAGIHSTHVSRYERSMASPSIDVAKKMAEALNVSVDTLIYGPQDEKAKNNLKDSDLLNMFTKVQQLDKQDVTTVKQLLKAFLLQKGTQARLAQ